MIGVLLMSYGSPDRLDEVEAYYTDIRHGRKPSPQEVANLRERYEAIGGKSPLLEITKRQAIALEAKLKGGGHEARVHIGMKHWHPYISEAIEEIDKEPIERLVAIPLAPHYSKMSIGGYRDSLSKALDKHSNGFKLHFIESWHLNPSLLTLWRKLIEDGLADSGGEGDTHLLFTAHSLPERILDEGDPYRDQLLATSSELARRLSIEKWSFAFQSAGHTSEKWLGPDIIDELKALKGQGVRNVLVAPIGFFSDHLEILYDIDIEAAGLAREVNLRLKRTGLPNDTPLAIETLYSLVTSV
jgi:protoporphyrin/coproporphyrin ferrochelatase